MAVNSVCDQQFMNYYFAGVRIVWCTKHWLSFLYVCWLKDAGRDHYQQACVGQCSVVITTCCDYYQQACVGQCSVVITTCCDYYQQARVSQCTVVITTCCDHYQQACVSQSSVISEIFIFIFMSNLRLCAWYVHQQFFCFQYVLLLTYLHSSTY